MTKNLPFAKLIPIRLAPVGVKNFSIAKPRLLEPVSPSNIPFRIGGLKYGNYYSSYHDSRDTDELSDHKEVIEASTGFSTDRIGDTDDDQNENRK